MLMIKSQKQFLSITNFIKYFCQSRISEILFLLIISFRNIIFVDHKFWKYYFWWSRISKKFVFRQSSISENLFFVDHEFPKNLFFIDDQFLKIKFSLTINFQKFYFSLMINFWKFVFCCLPNLKNLLLLMVKFWSFILLNVRFQIFFIGY
jgi:hypothetical protein